MSQAVIPVESVRLRQRAPGAASVPIEKKPEWLKVKAVTGPNYRDMKALKEGLEIGRAHV